MFNITTNAEAIIDLAVDYRISNVFSPVASTVAAGTLGSVYYLALDGPSSNKLQVVGLPTTA